MQHEKVEMVGPKSAQTVVGGSFEMAGAQVMAALCGADVMKPQL
jgi:hypothetical protein